MARVTSRKKVTGSGPSPRDRSVIQAPSGEHEVRPHKPQTDKKRAGVFPAQAKSCEVAEYQWAVLLV